MAGGEIAAPCQRPQVVGKDASPPKTPPPRRRAERLACGLPAYVNRPLDLSNTPSGIPQVDEPWRPRAPAVHPKPKHAAPGAFELPPEWLTSGAVQPELVVAVAQDGLNRWIHNISNEISHKGRDIGPVFIDPLALATLRERAGGLSSEPLR